MDVERRITLSDATVEYRDAENGEKKPVISGYAAVFNSESRILNGFVETIHPSAFDEVLSTNPDVIGVFNHDRNLLLGRTSNGTMRLSSDAYGLRYEIMPNEKTSIGKDVVEWVKDRTVVGSSFAFAVRKDGTGDSWKRGSDGMQRREVRNVALLEDCGPVVRPAYPAASVVVSRRALEMALGENFRPSQTMANAAKRGLKLAERNEKVDQNLLAIAERIAGRQVVSVEECEYLSAVYERCLASKAKGWNGSAAWIEWQMAGGDAGQRWISRRTAKNEPETSENRSTTITFNDAATVEVTVDASKRAAAAKISLTPSSGMRSACRRGLKLYEEGRGGDGLVPETIAWAKKIAAGEALTEEKTIKMAAWHARHAVDKRPGWDKAGEETPGFVAFLLWAGAAGARWSQAKAKQIKENRDIGEDAEEYGGSLDDRQLAMIDAYESITESMGPWSRESSHYVADNPFSANGIACRNCVFYEDGACEIVAGEVAQDAICKLWVIPEESMGEKEPPKEESVDVQENSAPVNDETTEAIAKAAALKAILLSTQLHAAQSAT